MEINASFFTTAKKQTIHFYYKFAVIVGNLRRLIVDVVITGNAESQSAELCLQMVFVCLSQPVASTEAIAAAAVASFRL